MYHDDVIKWKHFPRNWPFMRGIHRSPVNSPHNGQWREALMFSLICVWIIDWVNNREAGDLRRYRAHSEVIVMCFRLPTILKQSSYKHAKPNIFKVVCIYLWQSRMLTVQMREFTASLKPFSKWNSWKIVRSHIRQFHNSTYICDRFTKQFLNECFGVRNLRKLGTNS